MHIHATATDLQGAPWNLDVDDTEAQALLARAATVIRSLTLTAIYHVGTDGTPSDRSIREALRDATCAQAAWFDEIGDTGSGASGRFNSITLGNARFSGGGTGSATNTDAGGTRHSPEAVQHLANAGLLNAGPLQ